MQLHRGLLPGLCSLLFFSSVVTGFLLVPTKHATSAYSRAAAGALGRAKSVIQQAAASDDPLGGLGIISSDGADDADFTLPGVVLKGPSTAPPPPPPPPQRSFPGGGRGGGRDMRGNNNDADKDIPVMNEQLLRNGPKEVRLIIHGGDEGDEMLGVVSTADAYQRAVDMGLDLIMIAEAAKPPVCKIIDYGKYRYSVEKKKKEQKKKAKTTEVKEVKMSYKIEAHDYGVRLRQISRFLEDGDRVKVMIQFRGREQQHIDLGMEMLGKIQADTKDFAQLESEIKREGGRLMAMFKPRPR